MNRVLRAMVRCSSMPFSFSTVVSALPLLGLELLLAELSKSERAYPAFDPYLSEALPHDAADSRNVLSLRT